jgi:uncharacterized membrane protein YkvI
MLAVIVLATVVPLALTATTIATSGAIWQGRYGIPLHVGAVLLAGLALDKPARTSRRAVVPVVAATIAVVLAQAVSIVHVLLTERARSPLSGTDEWPAPPVAAVVSLTLLCLASWLAALALSRRQRAMRGDPPATMVKHAVAPDRSDSVTA